MQTPTSQASVSHSSGILLSATPKRTSSKWKVTSTPVRTDNPGVKARIFPRQLKYDEGEHNSSMSSVFSSVNEQSPMDWSPSSMEQSHLLGQRDKTWQESSTTRSTDYSDCSKSFHVQDCSLSKFQLCSLTRTRKLMTEQPLTYMGISKHNLSILNLIAYKMSYSEGALRSLDIIFLVLRKLRLNESFQILANEFGCSMRRASRLFNTYISFIADHFAELIFPPSESLCKKIIANFI